MTTYLMKSNSSVDMFIQMESDDNEFKTCKIVTMVFLSSGSLAWYPPISFR